MAVMVTGGAGYIGSHAAMRLLDDGHRVVVVDSLRVGHAAAVERLAARLGPVGSAARERLVFRRLNAGDTAAVAALMREHGVDTVMHFAALAQVGESVALPLLYYRENVASMVGLLEACDASGVRRFVFSSSCATYGNPPEGRIPVDEGCPQDPTSPYGQTKLDGERMLRSYASSMARSGRPFACTMLRYFNVAGCDPSGVLGEDHDPETHLIPVAIQAALGRRDRLTIFGTDYPTPDGTCVRDYVHVVDLVDAHVRAMERMRPEGIEGERVRAYNVGIGRGYSVREIIDAVGRVAGAPVPVVEGERRAGDATALYNDPALVTGELGWSPRYTDVEEVVRHAWDWMRAHPEGYRTRDPG